MGLTARAAHAHRSHIDRFFARPLRGDERVRVRQLFRRFLDETALVLRSLTSGRAAPPTRAWPITWLFIRVTWVLLLIHVLEITVWALFHLWWECLPDAESAFYFSGVTCATIGYGELVLPKPWRMLAPIEGLTGILVCGLSAGLFVALACRIFALRSEETRR